MIRELVYDVGSYNGDDAAWYLQCGYRVVAIEADPHLADVLRTRFSAAVDAGRCTILNVGIAEQDGEASFYLCPSLPIWNSFDRAMATRDGRTCTEVKVQCRTFSSVLREHGVPYFLKVDIEGYDGLCVRGLLPDDLPAFVSFEAVDDVPELVSHLSRLGYASFRLVSQRGWVAIQIPSEGSARHVVWSIRQWLRLTLRRFPSVHRLLKALKDSIPLRAQYAPQPNTSGAEWRFPDGSSGPIPGHDSSGWLSAPEFLHAWISARNGGILESSWFDIHAMLGDPPVRAEALRERPRHSAAF